jgi:hypothetical protein
LAVGFAGAIGFIVEDGAIVMVWANAPGARLNIAAANNGRAKRVTSFVVMSATLLCVATWTKMLILAGENLFMITLPI